MKKLYLAMIIGMGLPLLSACSSTNATPEPLVINMTMSEFAFSPNVIEAKVGQQVTINMMNTGALQHEIMFGRNMMMNNGQPDGYKTDMFSIAGMEPSVTFAGMDGMDEGMMMGQSGMQHGGYSVVMPTGDQTAQMTITVTEDMMGEWEFGCFEQDGVHYTAGMVGTMRVSP